MKTNTKRNDWMITVPLAAVAVAYVVLVFLPGRRATDELKDQIALKQQTIGQTPGSVNALKASGKELARTRAYNTAWEQHAPARGEIPILHAKIRELAESAGTVITRFDPERSQTHGVLREIPLSVGCTGAFVEIFEFLRGLEGMPEAIWINSFNLEKTDATRGTMDCEISLVVFADNPENSDYVEHTE